MHGEIIRGNFLAQQAPERRLNFCRNGGSIQIGMVAQLVRTRCPTNPGIFKWTTPQILAAYFRQECIDRLFTDSNLDELFTAGPQFRLSHESIRPHLFCCLAALALTQVLRSLLKPSGIDMTAAELLDQLEMVRDGWLIHNNKKVSRVLEDMTDQPELQKLWTEVEKVTAIQKQEKSS